MRCGCEPERALYARHGVSFGVEGPNGMSSDVRGLGEHARLQVSISPGCNLLTLMALVSQWTTTIT